MKNTQIQKQIEEAMGRFKIEAKKISSLLEKDLNSLDVTIKDNKRTINIEWGTMMYFFAQELSTIATKSAEVERENTKRQVLSAFGNQFVNLSLTNSGMGIIEDIIQEYCDKDFLSKEEQQ